MNKPCDFCNRTDVPVKIVPYYSVVYGCTIKTVLCEECIKKEEK